MPIQCIVLGFESMTFGFESPSITTRPASFSVYFRLFNMLQFKFKFFKLKKA